jgi:hypothetical protein
MEHALLEHHSKAAAGKKRPSQVCMHKTSVVPAVRNLHAELMY